MLDNPNATGETEVATKDSSTSSTSSGILTKAAKTKGTKANQSKVKPKKKPPAEGVAVLARKLNPKSEGTAQVAAGRTNGGKVEAAEKVKVDKKLLPQNQPDAAQEEPASDESVQIPQVTNKEKGEDHQLDNLKTTLNEATDHQPAPKDSEVERGDTKFIGGYINFALYELLRKDAKSESRTLSKHMEYLLYLGMILRGFDITKIADIRVNQEIQLAMEFIQWIKNGRPQWVANGQPQGLPTGVDDSVESEVIRQPREIFLNQINPEPQANVAKLEFAAEPVRVLETSKNELEEKDEAIDPEIVAQIYQILQNQKKKK